MYSGFRCLIVLPNDIEILQNLPRLYKNISEFAELYNNIGGVTPPASPGKSSNGITLPICTIMVCDS